MGTIELAHWSRTEAFDCLRIDASAAREWMFVWTGRVVVQPLTGGVSWVPPSGVPRLLPLGTALIARAQAVHLRIVASAGASFLVLFERAADEATFTRRMHLPMIWTIPRVVSGLEDLFRAAVEELATTESPAECVRPFVTRARLVLEETLTDDLNLERLGDLAGVERCHLCRMFQRATGLPPYRYRLQLRIARARPMLAGGQKLTEVAHAVGFCDQSHFTRVFKALMGTTPSEYSRACAVRSAPALARAA